MQSSQDSKYQEDTIAAIATPPMASAISIIRISGINALAIAKKIFSKKLLTVETHKAYYGKILNRKKNILDEVLLIYMKSPKSFTGEDVIEIHCHGGPLNTQKIFEEIIFYGARPAEPGEFTKRAFLNNKIDLIQAEGIAEIISASNNFALKAASEKLEGILSKEIKNIQKELISIASEIEAYLDFPEDDIEKETFEKLNKNLLFNINKIESLLDTYDDGKIINEGATLAIIGSPNVGKSSLMNILLKKERSIVTKIAGTTRDTIEETANINNIQFKIIDTAGIRKTTNIIELEGINRSIKAKEKADITLLVIDAQKGLSEIDKELLRKINKKKSIIVFNKIDLKKDHIKLDESFTCVPISAKENINIDLLKKKLFKITLKNGQIEENSIIITNARHKNALEKALTFLKNSHYNLNEEIINIELIAFDIRFGLNCLSDIIGINITEDILSSIFSKFCIGK